MRIRDVIETVRADLHPGTERGRLVRSATTSVALKVGSVLITFVTSILAARVLGAYGYGLYAFVMACVAVLTLPFGLGLPSYLVREGVKFPESLGWLRRWADRRVVLGGLLAGLLLMSAAVLPFASGSQWLFVLAAPIPLLTNLSSVRQSLLQARGWIVRSQWPQLLFAPALLLLLFVFLLISGMEVSAFMLMGITTIAAIGPFVLNKFQLERACRDLELVPGATVALRASLPFMWLGALYLLLSRIDLLIIGTLRGPIDAGIYSIASKPAEVITFLAGAINTVIAPKIASLYHSGDRLTLQRLLTASNRRAVAISAPIALVLIVGATPLLIFLFGKDFSEGATGLRLLAASQLVIAVGGPLGTILDMTGFEKYNVKCMVFAVVLNTLLNFALVPPFGVTGAAAATLTSVVVTRLMLRYQIYRKLNISPGLFG
jgi:O-antigen/teichoic acid export membrane protein